MALIEISTRGWALGSSEVQCKGGRSAPWVCAPTSKADHWVAWERQSRWFPPPRYLVTSTHSTYNPSWQAHIQIIGLQKGIVPANTLRCDASKAVHEQRGGKKGPFKGKSVMAGNRPLSRDGGTFPGAGRGAKWGQHALHLHTWGSCSPSRTLLWPGMSHCDLTLLGQPTRQSDDVDCHVPPVNSVISP